MTESNILQLKIIKKLLIPNFDIRHDNGSEYFDFLPNFTVILNTTSSDFGLWTYNC